MQITSVSNFSVDWICGKYFCTSIFGEFVAIVCLFFHDSEPQKDESVGRIFGGTPSCHIVTCLLLCAARDLKSSQYAVHVVDTVHCTQRNQRPCVKENYQIFLSIIHESI